MGANKTKMRRNCINEAKGSFFALLELLLVLIIVLFLAYKGLNTYFKKPVLDRTTEKEFSEQGINTTSYQSVISGTKEKIEDISKKHTENLDRLNDIK
jgi:ABC-type phosphate transport system permease subunit